MIFCERSQIIEAHSPHYSVHFPPQWNIFLNALHIVHPGTNRGQHTQYPPPATLPPPTLCPRGGPLRPHPLRPRCIPIPGPLNGALSGLPIALQLVFCPRQCDEPGVLSHCSCSAAALSPVVVPPGLYAEPQDMDSELPAGLYVIACCVSSAPRPSLTELFIVVIVFYCCFYFFCSC